MNGRQERHAGALVLQLSLAAVACIGGVASISTARSNHEAYHFFSIASFGAIVVLFALKPVKSRMDWIIIAICGANVALRLAQIIAGR